MRVHSYIRKLWDQNWLPDDFSGQKETTAVFNEIKEVQVFDTISSDEVESRPSSTPFSAVHRSSWNTAVIPFPSPEDSFSLYVYLYVLYVCFIGILSFCYIWLLVQVFCFFVVVFYKLEIQIAIFSFFFP